MDNRPIGVFDSGLGGLTGVRELRKQLPGEDIVYFGDTGRVPYGSRSHETILQYARQDIAFLLSQNVKCIMAACGTVSSTFPVSEAEKLPVPYMGVVASAARKAAWATRNRKIGVIGTAATIRSRGYEQLLRRLVPGVEITARPCPLFVPLVENGYVDGSAPDRQQVTRLVIAQYLEEMPEFAFRTKVKAGLAGYAQVYGKYNTTPYDKLKLDLTYIESYSVWLDIKLMLLTLKILFRPESTEGVDEKQITAMKQEAQEDNK